MLSFFRVFMGCFGILLLSACASTKVRHPDYGQDCLALAGQGGLAGNSLNNIDCVRVFYGTNRVVLAEDTGQDGEVDTRDVLPKPGNELVLGRADIWLPKLIRDGGTRELGETPMLKGDMPEDKKELSKYVFITRITKNGKTSFIRNLEDDMDGRHTRSVLLFIHGFNVKFESALIRSAQLSVDLGEDGIFNPGSPVLFSWPSAGKMSLRNYKKDGKKADNSAGYLTEFLDILTTDVELRRINIIAHSMGNRVLVASLEDYAADYLRTHPNAKIEFRIIMAAADVERDIFDQVAGKLESLKANVTIYTSDDDLALKVSKIVNGVPRLGDTDNNKPYIREKDGFETVDATPVATELFGLGHGYYSSNPFILGDILCALAETPPGDRALDTRHYDGQSTEPEFFLTNPKTKPNFAECSLVRRTRPNDDPNVGFGYGMGSGRGVGGGGTGTGGFGTGSTGSRGLGGATPPTSPSMTIAPPPPPPPPPPSIIWDPVIIHPGHATLYFELGASDITEQHIIILQSAVSEYGGWGTIKNIRVTGYTDRSGNRANNLKLSRKRARNIADVLKGMNVSPNIITIEAEGENHGFIDTEDGVAEPLNRRVKVVIEYE